MTTLPTGAQYQLSLADQRCTVTEQGATLRSYTVGGHDVILPFESTALPQGCQGQQLLPWPNRIADGRYDFDGTSWQLPINEVDRNNALHGLANWVPWTLVDLTPTSVTQTVRILAQPGWPGVIEATITHALTETGLVVQVLARNAGSVPVPFGYAAHPYFVLGAPIDQWHVTVPFRHWLAVDPQRLLPIALHETAGVEPNLMAGALVGKVQLDTAYCDPIPDADSWRVVLAHADRRIEIWSEAGLGWLQLYTPADRASLAVEPMTCGPNAFNEGPTHAGLVRLESGDTISLRWGVSASTQ